MAILIINASPRYNNCFNIVNLISEYLKQEDLDFQVLNIWDMKIDYCNACGYCEKTGKCHIKDDMSPLYEKFDKSNGSIVVSPVYFDCVPAKLKTVIDRTQAFYASKYILKKPSIDRNKYRCGMFICLGGSEGYETQFLGPQIVMDFFFKSINTKLEHKIYINNTDKKVILNDNDNICNIKSNLSDFINKIREEEKKC